jgi:hypothetical protein
VEVKMPTLEFTDAETVPGRGRKREPVPKALMDAISSCKAKAFTGSEDEVAEIMKYINRIRRQGEFAVETGKELLEDEKVKLVFRATKI